MPLDLPPGAADQPYCWLTAPGRRTGLPRTVELWFALRGTTVYALAGGGEHADWVRNALAARDVVVRLAAREHPATARVVADLAEERAARRALAAKYQGWRAGRPLSRWAATALPVAFDLHEAPVAVPATRELQVARPARERLGLEATLFGLDGDLVLPEPRTARRVALGLSERSQAPVDAGDLFAAGLLHEIAHVLADVARAQRPDVFARALADVRATTGAGTSDRALSAFVDRFPPSPVYAGEADPNGWLASTTDGQDNAEVALEELLLHAVAAENPALAPFAELLDPGPLASDPTVAAVRATLERALAERGAIGTGGQDLPELLRAPIRASPGSLAGQLAYVRERWGSVVGARLDRILLALDLLREDETARRMRWFGDGGPGQGPGHAPELRGLDTEDERFSVDRDWMPSVVLLARNALVWLDQLSRRHGREIRRLDEVPDEELATIAARGFTGLWLIGLWQRSPASARIKQLRGNPEAAASAYALDDYRIADELGGDAALDHLREAAGRHGIRLASDMVPNHMAIDSRWVVERPELFVQTRESPYPSYRFTGPDLADDERVTVQIEDGYWNGTDAAVVFRREDRATGDVRYVYHGNDGTSYPWNDTAQLDFLRPETRQAVADAIIDVCRRFPIVRFDAAMVLAKRHFRRLWYPEPGAGGAIPSRAEHALKAREFDAAMPTEFWRDVVDRAAVEAPDTLLLAEAFWLLEGYFVRTLGMHRVYNSAFMNMLRDERNADYRKVLRETLELDPEILKRYVNFMSNPDERTAVDQFGSGDKYFAACTLLATLPGLPMFGHGQVEGFTEKYGMEYRRAYHDEQPDQWLVERHEREIFPLLRRRRLFSEGRSFVLYDALTEDGAIDEDVFAYSNRAGDERALVVVHNRFASARVRLRGVADALDVGHGAGRHVVFRDYVSGLEYLRPAAALAGDGMRVELDAYGRHVFLDWREVADNAERPYGRLADELGGRGVPSIETEMDELLRREAPHEEPPLADPEALLRQERETWQAWQRFAAAQGPTARRDDGWRMRDVQAHVAAWHRAATHGFLAMAAGETEWPWPDDTDAFNAEARRRWSKRPLAALEREAQEAHDEFVAALAVLDRETLEANDGLAAHAARDNGFGHYREHLADRYASRRDAAGPD